MFRNQQRTILFCWQRIQVAFIEKTIRKLHYCTREFGDNWNRKRRTGISTSTLFKVVKSTVKNASFFQNIEEVTGYVIIFRNTFRYLPLSNLKIVRGNELFKGKYALYVMGNYNKSGSSGIKELRLYFKIDWFINSFHTFLRLNSLTEIQRGGVFIEKNRDLCFVETINWFDIINAVSQLRNNWSVSFGNNSAKCKIFH